MGSNLNHTSQRPDRPGLELAQVFGKFSDRLGELPSDHTKVVQDILNCRTAVLGGHKQKCDTCSYEHYSYNSCRNRHCPKCQFLARQRWVENRISELLPVEYFHLVFTVPHELNAITRCNKRMLYTLLFQAASQTLIDVAKRKLNIQPGFTMVLHTWGQNLMDHPHIHAVVAGGGLSLNDGKWISTQTGFLLPVKVLSKVFRGKFLESLENSYSKLQFPGQCKVFQGQSQFKNLLEQAARKPWIVYAKAPFAGPKQVIRYLGSYTHRIALSNHRILKIDSNSVTFRYRDYRDSNKTKVMTLSATEFMRRFLLHVLPPGFVRIRHYGFLASRNKNKKIEQCRLSLKVPEKKQREPESWKELLERLTGQDIEQCPVCKKGKIQNVQTILPHPKLRSQRYFDTS